MRWRSGQDGITSVTSLIYFSQESSHFHAEDLKSDQFPLEFFWIFVSLYLCLAHQVWANSWKILGLGLIGACHSCVSKGKGLVSGRSMTWSSLLGINVYLMIYSSPLPSANLSHNVNGMNWVSLLCLGHPLPQCELCDFSWGWYLV